MGLMESVLGQSFLAFTPIPPPPTKDNLMKTREVPVQLDTLILRGDGVRERLDKELSHK